MYNVGDYVKVRSDLQEGWNNYGGLGVNHDMLHYRGRIFKIASITSSGNYELENVYGWSWNDEMLLQSTREEFESMRDRVICSDCGNVIENDEESYEVEGGNRVVCENCYEEYSECEDCGEMVHNDYIYSVGRYDDRYVCEECRNNNYTWCHNCEHYFPEDVMNYDEENDCYYCDDCYDNVCDSRIYGYHCYPRDFELYKSDKEDNVKWYLGMEIECENENVVHECVDYLYDNLDLILAHDGSLGTRGSMEMVYDARTIKSWYEKYDNMASAMKKLIDNGYKSHNTSTCGLHIHASRPYQVEIDNLDYTDPKRQDLITKQQEIIDRIILVMEAYKEELIKFSRRKSFNWCEWLSDVVCSDSGKIKSIDFIKKHKDSMYGHHRALNLENHNTIEFRIFKGTLKVETIYSCLELINNIMELCSDLSLPVEKITWAKLTRGTYISEYVKEQHIWTTKKVIDESEIDRIWRNIKSKKRKSIAKKIFKELDKWYENKKAIYDSIKDSGKWEDIYKTSAKLSVYVGDMKRLNKSYKARDFEDIAYKINDMIIYELDFEDSMISVRDTLKELCKQLNSCN